MPVIFSFRKIRSEVFRFIYRPYADVYLQKKDKSGWRLATMVVDTGADYTILPSTYAESLGIDLAKDCMPQTTHGIGGPETVFIYKGLIVKLANYQRKIPVGFLERADVPPLLGRHEFLETFRVVFEKHRVDFWER